MTCFNTRAPPQNRTSGRLALDRLLAIDSPSALEVLSNFASLSIRSRNRTDQGQKRWFGPCHEAQSAQRFPFACYEQAPVGLGWFAVNSSLLLV